MIELKDFGFASYILGIFSIVLSVLNPFAGFIIGIIGFVLSKKQKTDISLKAKKLNIIGIVIGIIMIIILIIATVYFAGTTLPSGIPSFPN